MPENLLAEWSRLLIQSLADAGLSHVVVSPGSRSTPLLWAVLECDRLSCERIIDERDAAFYAVGAAKISGRPVALLCTSGSAAANYFPAVVEAAQSNTPLLVLTADRPFELMQCGASQTIDQTRLYGDFGRAFFDLGMPDGSIESLTAVRRIASQALAVCVGDPPGPVQVNVRARKPLEPRGASTEPATALKETVQSLLDRPIPLRPRVERRVPMERLRVVADRLLAARSGLIVCGPESPAMRPDPVAVARLSAALGFPVFAEAASGQRFALPSNLGARTVDFLDWLLRVPSALREIVPEVVIQIGASPTSASWEALLRAHPAVARSVVAAYDWPDPVGTATELCIGDTTPTLEALVSLSNRNSAGADTPWSAWLGELDARAASAVDAELHRADLTEGGAVRCVVDSLSPGSLLCVGNSLPVRLLDGFCPSADTDLPVWTQRGASGIDGLVAGAAGAARQAGRSAALILGDVSFLHDLGGLAAAASLRAPFSIVVLHNDGGRIFEQLPVAARMDLPEGGIDYWLTPHGLDFRPAAELFGLPFARATTRAELQTALGAAGRHAGASVIEVRVPPSGAREQQARVVAAISTAIEPILASRSRA